MQEQASKESKEFMALVNKIKTNSQNRSNGTIDELLKESNAMIGGKEGHSMHPVFV